jgi:hypothetical protein
MVTSISDSHIRAVSKTAQGAWTDLALHTLGWKAFQDLCAHVSQEILKCPVEIYREAEDGGQDGAFLIRKDGMEDAGCGTLQCKFTSDSRRAIKLSDLHVEISL